MAKLKGLHPYFIHVKMMMFILGAKNIILIIKCENKQTLGSIRLTLTVSQGFKKITLCQSQSDTGHH